MYFDLDEINIRTLTIQHIDCFDEDGEENNHFETQLKEATKGMEPGCTLVIRYE